jgi:selenocysteine-specific elongation factor
MGPSFLSAFIGVYRRLLFGCVVLRFMKTVVIGTAGHIDHGKSSLVKALTGTDPDRWEEERRRGITIDLGFAYRALTDDVLLDFVDVPGHERFVKNMLAGAGGIDLVLFVIAADESIKPQTREHFDICRLLGVRSGVVALTKCDLVTPDMLDVVRLEAGELFAGSFLEDAPMIPVSALSGQGLDELLEALRRAAQNAPSRDSARPFRLPIDRAFVIKGFGTVVTGTLISGTLEKETEVEIYPTSRVARIRGVQAHGKSATNAAAGQRTAVNLAAVETSDLARGMVLAPPGRFRPTARFDARLHLLKSARPLKNRAPVHFHVGTAEGIAQVICLGRPGSAARSVAPGSTAFVQLHLREPLLLLPGDRFILRQFSPVITVGGGVVLDNLASRHKASEDCAPLLSVLDTGTRTEILAALLERGRLGSEEADLLARTGWSNAELREAASVAEAVAEKPLVLVSRARFAAAWAAMLEEVARFHKANPLVAGITREELRERALPNAHPAVFDTALARLIQQSNLEAVGEIVRQTGRQVVLDDAESGARRAIAEAFEHAGLAVPTMKEVLDGVAMDAARKQKILQLLLKERVLIRVTPDLVFHHAALDRLKELLAHHKARSNKINVGQFKELTGITRKYAIPLLEYMDRERVTRRAGDERIIL